MADKTFLNQVRGFTPVIDVLAQELGIMTALIYGIVWRYCQMRDGVCWASQETIADHVGVVRGTVHRHLLKLVEAGYLEDTTPDWTHKPHIYRDTGLVQITGLVQAKVGVSESSTISSTEVPRGVSESSTLLNEVSQSATPGVSESSTKVSQSATPGVSESSTKIVVRKNKEREEERSGFAAENSPLKISPPPSSKRTTPEFLDDPDVPERAKALLKKIEKELAVHD